MGDVVMRALHDDRPSYVSIGLLRSGALHEEQPNFKNYWCAQALRCRDAIISKMVLDVKFILLANNVAKATAESIISMLSFAILKGFHSNLLIAVP